MVHEHIYYPDRTRTSTASSAPASSRLYLAGGVTTMRTGGNTNGFMDINLRQQIDAGAAGRGPRSTPPRRISTVRRAVCRCTR